MIDSLHNHQWLASDNGQTVLRYATELRSAGERDLKIGERLRVRVSPEQAALVLTQLDLRERAAAKFSRASEMLFTRAGLEQSTNEQIATYRAKRFVGYQHIVELCCGIGGDLIALTSLAVKITPVDRDPVHLFLAEYNARVYHSAANITPILANVEDVALASGDAIYIDPARRLGSGQRTGYRSEPPLEWALHLAYGNRAVGIKAAPGLPRELIPDGWELEMISSGSDLKEAMLWSPALAREVRTATVISGDGDQTTLTPVPGETVPIREVRPGDWLHDVNPAVTNAGLVEDLARVMSAERIDKEIGFLVTNQRIEHAMTNSWRVVAVLPWHEKQIKSAIAAHNFGPIDIRRRGLAGDVPSITKRLRGKGDKRAIIAMTRVRNAPTAIICSLD